MPTDAHRVEARRVITLAGYPPPADPVDRARRTELIDALAVTIAQAEARAIDAVDDTRAALRDLLTVIDNVERHGPQIRYQDTLLPAAAEKARRHLRSTPAYGRTAPPHPDEGEPTMTVHTEWVLARHTAPALLHEHEDEHGTGLDAGHVGLALGETVVEGTHDEVRTLLVGALALVDYDARLADAAEAAGIEARDDDYTPAALDRDQAGELSRQAEAARADRLSWSPGDVVITPPPGDPS